jgi:hypothetical protein
MPDEKMAHPPSSGGSDGTVTFAKDESEASFADVQPGLPAARVRSLEDLMRDMAGDVDICEPVLASDAFDRLHLLRHCDMVRVLAHEVEEPLLTRIRSHTSEFPHFLFRRYVGRAIRDRYLLTPVEVLFLSPRTEDGNGHQQTMIRVPATIAGEMIEDVRAGYNRMWRASDRLG